MLCPTQYGCTGAAGSSNVGAIEAQKERNELQTEAAAVCSALCTALSQLSDDDVRTVLQLVVLFVNHQTIAQCYQNVEFRGFFSGSHIEKHATDDTLEFCSPSHIDRLCRCLIDCVQNVIHDAGCSTPHTGIQEAACVPH